MRGYQAEYYRGGLWPFRRLHIEGPFFAVGNAATPARKERGVVRDPYGKVIADFRPPVMRWLDRLFHRGQ